MGPAGGDSTVLIPVTGIKLSTDERITLITCWPVDSNPHRVVIVAFPIGTGF
jgi:sortase (surface protein transpeptidase)